MPTEDAGLTVTIRADTLGHWVEWNKDGEIGLLGPYVDNVVAGNVRTAKELELASNPGHIDDALLDLQP